METKWSRRSIVNKKAGSWTYPQLEIYLWIQDVHEQHDPRCWISTPWTTDTKRARSSHTTRRKRSNKKRSAYGSRTVPRSMLGFIRDRLDWWFDGTITTKNSKFLRRELGIFISSFSTSYEFCRSGSELCLGYLCRNARLVIIIGSCWWLLYTIFRE